MNPNTVRFPLDVWLLVVLPEGLRVPMAYWHTVEVDVVAATVQNGDDGTHGVPDAGTRVLSKTVHRSSEYKFENRSIPVSVHPSKI